MSLKTSLETFFFRRTFLFRWSRIIGAVIFLVCLFLFLCFALPSHGKDPEKSGISLSFLGIYQKAMYFWRDDIEKYSKKYGIDPLLVLSIAMYESGGNENLTSCAGAEGPMQVLPSTKEDMGITGTDTSANIETGIKYLKYLRDELTKYYGNISESRLKALMVQGYHGGLSRVKKGVVKQSTFQYLQGVSIFLNLLSQKGDEIKDLAKDIKILVLKKPKTWAVLSVELNVSVIELRLHNPFLAGFYSEEVPKDKAVAYPDKRSNLVVNGFYTSRRGDILRYLSNAFGISCAELRERSNLLMWAPIYPGLEINVSDSPHLTVDEKLYVDENQE